MRSLREWTASIMILHDQPVFVSGGDVVAFIKDDQRYMLHPDEAVNEHIVENGGRHYKHITPLSQKQLPFGGSPLGVS